MMEIIIIKAFESYNDSTVIISNELIHMKAFRTMPGHKYLWSELTIQVTKANFSLYLPEGS